MNNNENPRINGKADNIWDPVAFNKEFEQYIEENKKNRLIQQQAKLHDVNEIQNKEPEPYELPVYLFLQQILVTWNKLFTNILSFDLSIYTANDLLNIGITFIAIALLFMFLSNIFKDS